MMAVTVTLRGKSVEPTQPASTLVMVMLVVAWRDISVLVRIWGEEGGVEAPHLFYQAKRRT